MDEVVVTAYNPQYRAMSRQRDNINITNVISADQVSRFPDSNIGDALKRIPGINVQYDQGEARFGHIRGTSPDLSSVTIDGTRSFCRSRCAFRAADLIRGYDTDH